MSVSVLMLGFILGMRHALEGDHLAAMASLLTDTESKNSAVKQGIAWGLGHSITLLLFGLLAINLNIQILGQFSMLLEVCVGVMLVILGLNVIRQVVKKNIHVHRHDHEDGKTHIHFHSHGDEAAEFHDRHSHSHATGFPYSAISVGVMHGLAGTATLIVLAMASTATPMIMLQYILLYCIGTTLGMGMLSIVIVVSFNAANDHSRSLHHLVIGIAGIATIITGGYIIYEIGFDQGYLLAPI